MAFGNVNAGRCGVVVAVAAWLFAASALPALAADPAHQQFLFAYKLLQRGDAALAAEAFDRFLGDFPRDERVGDAAYYRALLYRKSGQAAEAEALLAAAPDPTLVPTHAARLLRGQVLSDLERHREALRPLEAIDASTLPDRVAATTRFLRGLTYRAVGNLEAAAADLQSAAALDTPLAARCRLELARVRVLQGNREQARRLLQAVLAGDGVAVEAEAARLAGELAYDAGDHGRAVEYFDRVIARHQTSPHFGPSVVGAMWAHTAAERPRRVLDLMQRHGDALPLQDRLPATYLRGVAELELGDTPAAVATFESIARGEGNYPLLEEVLYKLARAYFDLGQYDRARGAVGRLSERFPRSSRLADAAFLLALIDAEAGRVDRGVARLTELIEQGPDHPYHDQALLRRARLYERHGRPDRAIEDYLAFLSATPDGGTQAHAAALRLAHLALQQGRPDLAIDVTTALLPRGDLDDAMRQEAMFRRAIALTRVDLLDDATAQLAELENRYPLSGYAAETRYVRGLIAVRRGDADRAAELLKEAGFDDDLSAAQRENALRLLWTLQRDRAPDAAQDALVWMGNVVGYDALEDDERLWLAWRKLDENAVARVHELIEPILARDQASAPLAEALLLRAKAMRARERYDQAEQAVGRILAMGQGFDLEAMAESAAILGDRGEHAAAIGVLTPLTVSESTPVAARALLRTASHHRALAREAAREGDAATRDRRLAEAARVLKRLVILYPFDELSPLPQRAYLDLAEVELARGNPDTAERELRELIETFGQSPHAAVGRAMLEELRPPLGRGVTMLRAMDRSAWDAELRDRVDRWLSKWEARS